MPEDAIQAIGHGLRAKRSKSGAVSFDLVGAEDSNAAVQLVDRQARVRFSQGTDRTGQSGEDPGRYSLSGGRMCFGVE